MNDIIKQVEDALQTKIKLKFNSDGKFKILLMSDIHAGKGFSPQLPVAVKRVFESVKPDLVLFGGDMGGCRDDCHIENEDDLREVLNAVTGAIEESGTPWAHVFGNHDDNFGYSREEQQKVYESYRFCLSRSGPEDIFGCGNYVLPIYSSDGKKIAFNVWGLDSNDNLRTLRLGNELPEDEKIVLYNHAWDGTGYDMPHFDQVNWYYDLSKELERYNGERIPALMYMHIPVPEIFIAYTNRSSCEWDGNCREAPGAGEFNSGLFAASVKRKDVKAMFFGHDHINDFTARYCGIQLGYDAALTYDGYIDDDIRGARVFELDENAEDRIVKTYMVTVRSVMGLEGDKR